MKRKQVRTCLYKSAALLMSLSLAFSSTGVNALAQYQSVSENSLLMQSVSDNAISQNSISENDLDEDILENETGPLQEDLEAEGESGDTLNPSTDSATSDTPETTEQPIGIVEGVQIQAKGFDTIALSFSDNLTVDGYEIYRGLNATGNDAVYLASLPKSTLAVQTYEDKANLAVGKTYYYKIKGYREQNGQRTYGDFSVIASAKVGAATPLLLGIKKDKKQVVNVSYQKMTGANGYYIYRSTKMDKGYKKIGTVKKEATVIYQDKTCKQGNTYYYKIKAYKKVGGKTYVSAFSQPMEFLYTLAKPKLKSVVIASGETAKLTWNKIAGATGYQIYRSESQDKGYKKVKTIKKGATTSVEIGGQTNGKAYYYKIRAYCKASGKGKYSEFSAIKSLNFNLWGSNTETYQDKAQRIFGLDYYQKYASQAEAEKHMKPVVVQVWDFGNDKVTKITKYRTLYVHENIVETVKQIFKEIYEGDEHFPIKNVGGYSWRGDTSRSEHCCGLAIDINWEENYMIDNGVILSGKYWKPGEDPYSIPRYGDVENAMLKYGFTRGEWGNRIDYMHFSYFGT